MGTSTISAACKHCGFALSPQHTAPCPQCGKHGKNVHANIGFSVPVSGSLEWERVREFVVKNNAIEGIMWAITVLSPFLGLVISGQVGVAVGLALGLVSQVLGRYASTKIREITRGT